MSIETVTPAVLRDVFRSYSQEQRKLFVRLMAYEITGDEYPVFMQHLSPSAQKTAYQIHYGNFVRFLQPSMVEMAFKIVRDNPSLTLEDMKELLLKQTGELVTTVREAATAEVKAKRDRKSDPEIIRRNLEILKQREPGPNQKSQGDLARKYKVSDRAIRLVEEEASKWLELGAKLQEQQVPPPPE